MRSSALYLLALSATAALAHITEPAPTESVGCVEGEHEWICAGPAITTPAAITTTPTPAAVTTSSAEEHHHEHEEATSSEGHAHATGHAHSTGVVTNGTIAPTSSPAPFEGGAVREEGVLVGILAVAGWAIVGWVL